MSGSRKAPILRDAHFPPLPASGVGLSDLVVNGDVEGLGQVRQRLVDGARRQLRPVLAIPGRTVGEPVAKFVHQPLVDLGRGHLGAEREQKTEPPPVVLAGVRLRTGFGDR